MRATQAWSVLGELMRQLREVAGMTLVGAADASGWNKSHLSRVERGYTKPSVDLVSWYDDAFRVDGALVRQFVELEASVRADRARTTRDRHLLPPEPHGRLLGVPADYQASDRCRVVAETVPDGTILGCDVSLEKSWTLRNAGPVHWRGRHLTRQGQPAAGVWLQSPMQVPITDAAPDATITVVVPLLTPHWAGTYVAYFKITDSEGCPYFPQLRPIYCTIHVTDELMDATE
jgi:transcriptional regulator with XRE-family HTH domain